MKNKKPINLEYKIPESLRLRFAQQREKALQFPLASMDEIKQEHYQLFALQIKLSEIFQFIVIVFVLKDSPYFANREQWYVEVAFAGQNGKVISIVPQKYQKAMREMYQFALGDAGQMDKRKFEKHPKSLVWYVPFSEKDFKK